MNRQSLLFKGRTLFVHILVLVSVVVSGCGAAATQAPAVTEAPATAAPATEAPATGEPAATEAPATEASTEPVVISLLYPDHPEIPDWPEKSFIVKAVEDFNTQQTEIIVDLQLISAGDYRDTLAARVAGGEGPDVALVDYSDLYPYYRAGILLSLEDAEGFLDSDFMDDSVRSTQISDRHYGVPWRRDSCSLTYEYLSITVGSKDPPRAFKVMDFLAQTSLQEQAYQDLAWYPTRNSAYASLGIGCSLNEAVHLPDEVRDEVVVKLVPESEPVLKPVLEGHTVEAGGATGVFENGTLVAYGAAVADPVSLEQAQEQLNSTGLVMGILIIKDVEEYSPGSYVVKCFTDNCVLVSPDTSEIPFNLIFSEDMSVPVTSPRIVTVPGSEIKCYWYYFWVRCSKVG